MRIAARGHGYSVLSLAHRSKRERWGRCGPARIGARCPNRWCPSRVVPVPHCGPRCVRILNTNCHQMRWVPSSRRCTKTSWRANAARWTPKRPRFGRIHDSLCQFVGCSDAEAQRRGILTMQIVSIAMAFSTVGGIAAITPFFAVLGQPQLIDHNAMLHWAYGHGGFSSKRGFVLALGIAFILRREC